MEKIEYIEKFTLNTLPMNDFQNMTSQVYGED